MKVSVSLVSTSAAAPSKKMLTNLALCFEKKQTEAALSKMAETLLGYSKHKALSTSQLDAFLTFLRTAKPEEVTGYLQTKAGGVTKQGLLSLIKSKNLDSVLDNIAAFKCSIRPNLRNSDLKPSPDTLIYKRPSGSNVTDKPPVKKVKQYSHADIAASDQLMKLKLRPGNKFKIFTLIRGEVQEFDHKIHSIIRNDADQIVSIVGDIGGAKRTYKAAEFLALLNAPPVTAKGKQNTCIRMAGAKKVFQTR